MRSTNDSRTQSGESSKSCSLPFVPEQVLPPRKSWEERVINAHNMEPVAQKSSVDCHKLLEECINTNNIIGGLLDLVCPSLEYQLIHKQMNEQLMKYLQLQNDLSRRVGTLNQSLLHYKTRLLDTLELSEIGDEEEEVDDVSNSSGSYHVPTHVRESGETTGSTTTTRERAERGDRTERDRTTEDGALSHRDMTGTGTLTREGGGGILRSFTREGSQSGANPNPGLLASPRALLNRENTANRDAAVAGEAGSSNPSPLREKPKFALTDSQTSLPSERVRERPSASISSSNGSPSSTANNTATGFKKSNPDKQLTRATSSFTISTTRKHRFIQKNRSCDMLDQNAITAAQNASPNTNAPNNPNNNANNPNGGGLSNKIPEINIISPQNKERKMNIETNGQAQTTPSADEVIDWDEDDCNANGQTVYISTNQLAQITADLKRALKDYNLIALQIVDWSRSLEEMKKTRFHDYLLASAPKNKKLQTDWKEKFGNNYLVGTDEFFEAILDVSQRNDADVSRLVQMYDPHGFGFITPLRAFRSLKLFGPCLDNIPKEVKTLIRMPFFQGYWDTMSVRKLLMFEEPGTFLVHCYPGRPDLLAFVYVLESEDKRYVTSQPILRTKGGKFVLGRPTMIDVKPWHAHSLAGSISRKTSQKMEKKKRIYNIEVGEPKTATLSLSSPVELPEGEHDDAAMLSHLDIEYFSSPLALVEYYQKKLGWRAFINRLTDSRFFFVGMTKAEAFANLKKHPVGTSIICLSEDQSQSFLSVVYIVAKGKCNVIKLERDRCGLVQCENKERQFQSLNDFLSFYEETIRYNWSPSKVPDTSLTMWNGRRSTVTDFWGPKELGVEIEEVSVPMGIACKSVSTYPAGTQGAAVICDQYRIRKLGNRMVMVVCDGCNWGPKPREAARVACEQFCDHLSSPIFQENAVSSTFLQRQLHGVVMGCHKRIIKGEKDLRQVGTTTICGGLLAQMVVGEGKTPTWAFLCISVGDCKVFKYSEVTRTLTDITWGNRADSRDASDPGGRIGPYIFEKQSKDALPDYRNKTFFFTPCLEGEYILMMSDGVYDNVDPEHLGKTPNQLNKNVVGDCVVPPNSTWESLDMITMSTLKENYIVYKLQKLIHKVSDVTPTNIINTLIDNARRVTSNTRNFLEKYPNQNEPQDYVNYPGKVDHSTCICIRVTDREAILPTDEVCVGQFPSPMTNSNSPSSVSTTGHGNARLDAVKSSGDLSKDNNNKKHGGLSNAFKPFGRTNDNKEHNKKKDKEKDKMKSSDKKEGADKSSAEDSAKRENKK